MNSEIPLIKDLNDTFSDNNIESIFDVKIINMYNNFNNKVILYFIIILWL